MEKNRNIDFDSEVEVDSLKDAVWRLTTRVYLLEDFIAETFGQVIGPAGFTKATMITTPVPQTATGSNAKVSSQNQNAPSRSSGRKRRKRHYASTGHDQTGGPESKLQRNPEKSMDSLNEGSNSSIGIQLDSEEQSESELLLIPKDEILLKDGGEVDASDYFLDDKSDDDEDHNDSVAKDPDFDPLTNTPGPSRNIQDKKLLLSSKDIDQVHFVKSQRGKDKLVHAGFVYCHIKDLKSGGSNWTCEKRPKCKASISYSKSRGLEMHRDHDHPADPGRLEVLNLMEKIRQEAQMPDLMPSSIYAKAIAELSAEAVASINKESCKRLIRNRKKKSMNSDNSKDKEPKTPEPQSSKIDKV